MFWLFDSNNPITQWLSKLFDCVALSVLWFLFSLPVITVGAATTALYSTVYHYMRREEGRLFRTFWNSFRENFARSTLIWLIMLAGVAIIVVDILGLQWLGITDTGVGKLCWLMLVLLSVVVACWFSYLFACAARFPGSLRDILQVSFLMMGAHPIRSLGVFLPACCSVVLMLYFPLSVVILPAAACWVVSLSAEKVFSAQEP